MNYNLHQISQILNISPRRIQQLVKDGVIDQISRGVYEPISCMRKYILFLQTALAKRNSPGTSELQQKKIELMESQKTLNDIEIRKQRRDLLERRKAIADVAGCAAVVRDRLLAIPSRVGPIVAAESDRKTCENVIEKEIRETLKNIGRTFGLDSD